MEALKSQNSALDKNIISGAYTSLLKMFNVRRVSDTCIILGICILYCSKDTCIVCKMVPTPLKAAV